MNPIISNGLILAIVNGMDYLPIPCLSFVFWIAFNFVLYNWTCKMRTTLSSALFMSINFKSPKVRVWLEHLSVLVWMEVLRWICRATDSSIWNQFECLERDDSTGSTSNIVQSFLDICCDSMFDGGSISGNVGHNVSSMIKSFGSPDQFSKSSCGATRYQVWRFTSDLI